MLLLSTYESSLLISLDFNIFYNTLKSSLPNNIFPNLTYFSQFSSKTIIKLLLSDFSVQEIYLCQYIIAVFLRNTIRKNPTRTFELSTEVCLFQFIVFVSTVEWRIASNVQDYNHKIYFKHPSALSTPFEAVEGI